MKTLLLLPGLDGTGELFSDFIEALPKDIHTITASYPTNKPMDYDELEPYVQSLMPEEGSFFLLAESFSGPLAVRLAATFPDRVKGLIFCCTFIKNPHPIFTSLRPLTHYFPFKAMPFCLFKLTHFGDLGTQSLSSKVKKIIDRLDNKVIQKRIRAVLSEDTSEAFKTLKQPMIYLRATQDWVIFCSSSEHILSLAPHTQIIDIQAPHFMLQTKPIETAGAVADFVEKYA